MSNTAIVNSAEMEECIEAAWQEIKDRKGQLVGGVFVKDAA